MHERASTVVSKIRLSEKPNVLISMASIPSISSFPLPVYVLLKINLCLQSSQNVLFNSISTVAVCDENSDVTCIIWLQRELEHWSSTVSSGLDFNLTSQKIEYILWFTFLSFSSSSLHSNWLNTFCKNMLRYSVKRRLKHTPPKKTIQNSCQCESRMFYFFLNAGICLPHEVDEGFGSNRMVA